MNDVLTSIVLAKIFSIERESRHCHGKREKVIAYDHTGYVKWKCECGYISGWVYFE